MKTATALLRLDQFTTIVVSNITPAEAVLLVREHQTQSVAGPFSNLKETDEVKRSPSDEAARLRAKYGKSKFDLAFPGAMLRLPKTFEESGALTPPADETPQPIAE